MSNLLLVNGTDDLLLVDNASLLLLTVNPTPTALTPTTGATVTTDVPTLGLTITAGDSQKAQWDIATDSGFTANLRTVTEADADLRTSGATTEVVPTGVQLWQTTWYIRGRSVAAGGSNPSDWTATNSFTVTHAPAMANKSPVGGVVRDFAGTGIVLLDWDFSDSSSVDTQSAKQTQVRRNSDALSIDDSGKVTSAVDNASVTISGTYKDTLLDWRGRLWDSDDVVGAYSDWDTFYVADAPVVAITSPASGGSITQPDPTVTWTVTASLGRTQAQRRVRIVRVSDSVTVHEAALAANTTNSYTPPSSVCVLGVEYDVIVDIIDTGGLTGSDTNRATAVWAPPAAPSFVVAE